LYIGRSFVRAGVCLRAAQSRPLSRSAEYGGLPNDKNRPPRPGERWDFVVFDPSAKRVYVAHWRPCDRRRCQQGRSHRQIARSPAARTGSRSRLRQGRYTTTAKPVSHRLRFGLAQAAEADFRRADATDHLRTGDPAVYVINGIAAAHRHRPETNACDIDDQRRTGLEAGVSTTRHGFRSRRREA